MKFWALVREGALAALDNLFYWVAFLFKKDEHLWVFGSMFGNGYADNSKYFFEYVRKEHPGIRSVWFSGNRSVVAELRQVGAEAYRFYDPRGIALLLKARVAVVSHSQVRDIRPFMFASSTCLVNLWHGIPLKKIALDDKVAEVRNRPLMAPLGWLSRFVWPGFRRQPDLLTAASEEDRRNFSSAFALPVEKIKITGYPRNDLFFKTQGLVAKVRPIRRGIYVPTFRGKEGSSFDFFSRFGFDIEQIDSRLAKLGVELCLKLHHFNYPADEIVRSIHRARQIYFYTGQDIYQDLPDFDFLVTDFSSIYFDYILTGQPVIFAPFDQAGYEQSGRQLYYEYEEVTPGPKATCWPEVLDCIKVLVSEPLRYEEPVRQIRERFQTFNDGHNSDRVYQLIAWHLGWTQSKSPDRVLECK